MKKENKAEIRQKKGFAKSFAALLALCAVSNVFGNETAVYEFRPANLDVTDVKTSNRNVFDEIDLEKSGRFVSVVGFLAGLSKDEFEKTAVSFFKEAKELMTRGQFDEAYAVHDLGKDRLADSKMMGKVEGAANKIGLALTIAEGVVKIREAKTDDERVTESCRLALHLFTTALDTLTKIPIGSMISYLGDHGLDHPEDNGFAIVTNWIYDHSSLPEMLSEWWWDVRYKDKILVQKDGDDVESGQHYEFIPPEELADYGDVDQEDPFDTMPESNGGCFDGNTSEVGYQGLKPLRLID